MTNIWGVLLQSVEVSIVAILLLIIKELFRDKLSPKWQYHVWWILCVSCLIPTGIFGTYLIPQVAILVEMSKAMVERLLTSSYSLPYETIQLTSVFPRIISKPTSITDIILILYILGIGFVLLNYFIQYIQLRRIVSKSTKADKRTVNKVDEVASTYHFKICREIVIADVPSAFIFGVINPTLVLPKKEIDYKVILHELYHLKYKDSLHNTFWSILMALHWWNPLMHYVLNQIRNDLEILCDQRVLETVIGEERRDYGRILLDMTNEAYPRAFCTSSISNGTLQIKKRIESIVRFKKYPKQMLLLSLCISILLTPIVFGCKTKADINNEVENKFQYEYAMASARLAKIETLAGAIDTYAKGIIRDNESFILAALPNDKKDDFNAEIEKFLEWWRDDLIEYYHTNFYQIYNLKRINHKTYEAVLALNCVNQELQWNSFLRMIPIRITKDDSWHVEIDESKEIMQLPKEYMESNKMIEELDNAVIKRKVSTGNVTIEIQSLHTSNIYGDHFRFSDTIASMEANTDLEFEKTYYRFKIKYEHESDKIRHVGILVEGYDELDQVPVENKESVIETSGGSGGYSDTFHFSMFDMVSDSWDGVFAYEDFVECMGGIESRIDFYKYLSVSVFNDYELVETIIIERDLL